jgi:hypothetical protein
MGIKRSFCEHWPGPSAGIASSSDCGKSIMISLFERFMVRAQEPNLLR